MSGTGLSYRFASKGHTVSIVLAQNDTGTQTDTRGAQALPTITVGTPQAAEMAAGGQEGLGAGGGVAPKLPPAQDPYNRTYVLPDATTGAKTDTPIMDTPLNVQVVTQQVLKDQQDIRLDQALQNVSGVSVGSYGTRTDGASQLIYLRGFSDTFELSQLTLPRDLPVSLPSHVVAQRPDIKAAEANVHSASAQIGVAVAARFPNIVLTANGGSGAFKIAQLFTPGTGFYTLAGNVAQPLFDGMTLLNKQRAAEAGLDQVEPQYRSTVITAFQNVADTLRALQGDARAVRDARIAESASRKYLDKIRSQQKFGGVSQLAVVDAQRSYLNASIVRVQAEAQRLTDTVALFVALGGGW